MRCFDRSIEVTLPGRFTFANRLRLSISYRLFAADLRIATSLELAGDGRCEQ